MSNPFNASPVGTHSSAGASGGAFSPYSRAVMYNDFNGAVVDPFYSTVSGAGAAIQLGIYGGVGGWGRATMSTGTTGTGYAAIRATNSGGSVQRYDNSIMMEARVKLGTALSSGTERFVVRVGASDSNNADSANGFYFRYSDDLNGGKWQCVTRRASAETAADSGVTVNYSATLSAEWYKLKIVYPIEGTSVHFYINGNLVQSIATNLPDNFTPCCVLMTKTIGTTSRDLYVDYIFGEVEFPNGR